MELNDFIAYVKTGALLESEEIHEFMHQMSEEARRITFQLNSSYHTQEEIRQLLSQLFGYEVPASLNVFPPLYSDFGKNIHVGHGGVFIGNGCQIGHNVVFATLNHCVEPEKRGITYPAPIHLGKNVWVGSNATLLQGIHIGDNAIIAAGAVVTKDVAPNTLVAGVPARPVKKLADTEKHQ